MQYISLLFGNLTKMKIKNIHIKTLPNNALIKSKTISLHPPTKLTNTNSPILAFQVIYELIAALNPSFAFMLA